MGRPTAWQSVYRPTYHRPAQISGVYIRLRMSIPLHCSTLSPLQSLQRQYVLTCKMSRYCILALYGSCKRTPRYNMYNEATRYHVVAERQSADVIVHRTIPRRWPSIETTRINVTCLLVYGAYIVASELKDPICHSNECQIGSFSSEATIYWNVQGCDDTNSVCVDWSGMSISSYDLLKM